MDNVSVIVPIYNAESTIERCVNSILNQSYKNFELILIDDGSTDNSLKVIINNYKNIKNIKIITQKNIGVARTRNKGIKIAKGKYIMFIDNDDFIDIDYIEKHVDKIKKGFDVVISGYRRVDEENRILCEKKLKNSFWSRYIIITPWARIFKRNFLLKNNIQFLNYDIGEDIYFNLSLYSFSPKVGILNYVGYNWFYNNLSISNTKHKGLNNNVDNLVLLNNIMKCYKNVDEYLSYYLIKYYIWYLLYSGRSANKDEFMNEYYRLKAWYDKNNITLSFSPFSNKINGEKFKNRIIIFIFIILEKLKLVRLFAKIYCKDDK